MHELRERVDAPDMRVVQGRCRSYGGLALYSPFVETLRELLQLPLTEKRCIPVDDVVAGVKWVVDNGARVVNLSLGDPNFVFTSLFGTSLKEAIDYAWAHGAIPVLASGNTQLLGLGSSNYGDLNAVVVGATAPDDSVASYSSPLGNAKWAILAPGGAGDGTAERIRMPLLVCVAEQDTEANPELAIDIARKAPRGVLKTYAARHFDVYTGAVLQQMLSDQAAFLREHLSVGPADERPSHPSCI